jgi:ABC-type glycerol-3-phosphate transport system substrate-binding protein
MLKRLTFHVSGHAVYNRCMSCNSGALRTVRSAILILFLAWLGLSALTGCSSSSTAAPHPAAGSPAVRPFTQSSIPAPVATGPGAPAPPPTDTTSSGVFVLTWWTPEFISPKAGQAGGGLMGEYLSQFEQTQGGKVKVNPVLKARYGKGGLLDYLRTAQPVAPGILPDVVVLDTAELEKAAGLGLLQPLDKLLAPQLLADLYPFAREVGQFDGQQLAVQYVADLDHVAYSRAKVAAPPINWNSLLANKTKFLFPAGNPQPAAAGSLSDDVQAIFISQYVSAGGIVKAENRQLVLQEEPLLRVLTFYSEGQMAGVLPPAALDLVNPDDAFSVYARGDVEMANVSAHRFLASQDSLPNTGFAPLPGWDEPAPPVAQGWALAITTTDPVRQKVAAEFIVWLLSAQRSGAWAEAAGWLPVMPQGWQPWGSAPYYDFLYQQLATAIAHPAGPGYSQTAGQLRKAIVSVLKDRVSPAQAVQVALTPLAQNK